MSSSFPAGNFPIAVLPSDTKYKTYLLTEPSYHTSEQCVPVLLYKIWKTHDKGFI